MSRRIARLSDETATRFRDSRQAAQERMGRTELCNDEFLTLLLDVYALHLEREGRAAEASRGGESQPIADGGDWVACEDCGAEYRSEQAARGCCAPTETRAFIPDGGQSTAGTERCWDREDCPRDGCDGELQQQDQFNVMCRSCEAVWTHWKREREHVLVTAEGETVARKPRAVTDGGQPTTENHLADGGCADGAAQWSVGLPEPEGTSVPAAGVNVTLPQFRHSLHPIGLTFPVASSTPEYVTPQLVQTATSRRFVSQFIGVEECAAAYNYTAIDDRLRADGGQPTGDTDPFLQWLDKRIGDASESHKRDTNPRHTNISLGKVRAYKHVREEYLERSSDTATGHENTSMAGGASDGD